MKYDLEVVCMYCGKHLKTKKVSRPEEAGVSHGTCLPCKARVLAELVGGK